MQAKSSGGLVHNDTISLISSVLKYEHVDMKERKANVSKSNNVTVKDCWAQSALD